MCKLYNDSRREVSTGDVKVAIAGAVAEGAAASQEMYRSKSHTRTLQPTKGE
jgi:hypothetical protein